MPLELILGATSAVVASALAALLAAFRQRQLQRHEEQERTELRKHLTELRLNIEPVSVARTELPDETVTELLERVQEQIADRIAARPGGELAEVKRELSQELTEFRERIAKIERRFPDEAQLEKIASINDALLSERIDQLRKRLDNLEARTLTRWDVALVVSAIIGGVSAVVAGTVGVIRFLSGS